MGSGYELRTQAELGESDRETIYRWLREFNQIANGPFFEMLDSDSASALIVVARNDHGEPVGGLVGESFLHWMKVHIMAVDPGLRRHGIGSRMLADVERAGADRSCLYSYVDTMDYQAPAFYEKNGYRVAGRIEDWDSHGHAKCFFVKSLAGR